jgi:HSP20 family molecular chaperone IbpA
VCSQILQTKRRNTKATQIENTNLKKTSKKMIFLRRPINKLSSEAPTYMHPGFCSGSRRPTFAVFVTENSAPTAEDSMMEEATRKISNNKANSHNTRGFKKHDDTDDAYKTKTPTSKGAQQQGQSPAPHKNEGTDASFIFEKPRIQQTESEEQISIALDVSGYTVDDLQIDMNKNGRILTIAGGRRNRIGMNFAFSRRLGLKIGRLDMESLRASLVEGVLEVSVQKKTVQHENSSRIIPISTGDDAIAKYTKTVSEDATQCSNDDSSFSALSPNQQVEKVVSNDQEEAASVESVDESASACSSKSDVATTPVETVTEQDDDSDTPASPEQGSRADGDKKKMADHPGSAKAEASTDNSSSMEERRPDGERDTEEKESESWEEVVDMFRDGN